MKDMSLLFDENIGDISEEATAALLAMLTKRPTLKPAETSRRSEMSNDFEFFEGTASENTAPRVTVRKGGQLVLTRGTVELLGEGVRHVQLGFNPTTRVVAIRAVEKEAKGSYQLRRQGRNGLNLVTGKRFFVHYGLDVEKARAFDVEPLDTGLVGFRLNGDPAVDVVGEEEEEVKKARSSRRSAEAA